MRDTLIGVALAVISSCPRRSRVPVSIAMSVDRSDESTASQGEVDPVEVIQY